MTVGRRATAVLVGPISTLLAWTHGSLDDRVYCGQDGRYCCSRNDGTTGDPLPEVCSATRSVLSSLFNSLADPAICLHNWDTQQTTASDNTTLVIKMRGGNEWRNRQYCLWGKFTWEEPAAR